MITKTIYNQQQIYSQEMEKILEKYNLGGSMLKRQKEDFLAVAQYCCKAIRYIIEIDNPKKRPADFLWKKLQPEWQKRGGGDISLWRFRQLMKDVNVEFTEYKMHPGLRLIILDCVVIKACQVDEYYRHVIAFMKAKNEAKLLRIFDMMFVYYNNLKTPEGYKGIGV